MPDNEPNTGKQDDIRVDKNDPSAVEYLHSQLPHKTQEAIIEAIEKYGPIRKDIIDALQIAKWNHNPVKLTESAGVFSL